MSFLAYTIFGNQWVYQYITYCKLRTICGIYNVWLPEILKAHVSYMSKWLRFWWLLVVSQPLLKAALEIPCDQMIVKEKLQLC
jgi:hypothetical protein